ncbi:MAG: hypothetical protein AABW93_03235 [Nanoarchaeota archaeon]
MDGSFRFNDTDLERDVSKRLEKILSEDESLLIMPHITLEEINKYTREAMEDAKNQGNMALYQGLVLYITKIALKKARESH